MHIGSTGMKIGTDVELGYSYCFLRALKPTVICNGIAFTPSWTPDSSEHGDTEMGLCKLVYRHEICYRRILGYCDPLSSESQNHYCES